MAEEAQVRGWWSAGLTTAACGNRGAVSPKNLKRLGFLTVLSVYHVQTKIITITTIRALNHRIPSIAAEALLGVVVAIGGFVVLPV